MVEISGTVGTILLAIFLGAFIGPILSQKMRQRHRYAVASPDQKEILARVRELLIRELEMSAANQDAGRYEELGASYDKITKLILSVKPTIVVKRSLEYDGYCVLDSWLDSYNHGWLHYEPLTERDWPRLARMMSEVLKGEREFNSNEYGRALDQSRPQREENLETVRQYEEMLSRDPNSQIADRLWELRRIFFYYCLLLSALIGVLLGLFDLPRGVFVLALLILSGFHVLYLVWLGRTASAFSLSSPAWVVLTTLFAVPGIIGSYLLITRVIYPNSIGEHVEG